MKKIVSLFLALLLLLSISGCMPQSVPVTTQPQQTTAPVTSAPVEQAEKVVIPYLIGKQISDLPETDDYVIEEIGQEHSEYPLGAIVMQDPEGGAWVDKGTVIHVITSLDQSPDSEQPYVTEPVYWEPSDRDEQDRPDYINPQPDQPTTPQPTEPTPTEPAPTDPPPTDPKPALDPNGSYTTKKDVALYIHLYGRLPKNFITKNQAEDMYGKTSGLNKYGKCIGGDRFYNREGNLPGGYTYYECDIDTLYSSKRGAKRLVFTYSGIIYYTDDHYETFTRLY